MSTINKTGTTVTSGVPEAAIPYIGKDKHYVAKTVIDLTGGAITAADIYQSLALREDTLVRSVHIEILTAPVGTSLIIDIGDGGDANGWIGSFNVTTGGEGSWDHSASADDAYVSIDGYFYTTADTIDVVMATASAITAGPKFAIYAECVDMN